MPGARRRQRRERKGPDRNDYYTKTRRLRPRRRSLQYSRRRRRRSSRRRRRVFATYATAAARDAERCYVHCRAPSTSSVIHRSPPINVSAAVPAPSSLRLGHGVQRQGLHERLGGGGWWWEGESSTIAGCDYSSHRHHYYDGLTGRWWREGWEGLLRVRGTGG